MHKYQIKRALGEGSFAIVYEAERDGMRCAVKKFKQRQRSWEVCLNMRELRSIKSMGKHENLVALKEVILERDVLHMVFEFLDCDLHRLITSAQPHGGFSDEQVVGMSAGLFSGISHMHTHGFMHRDLKPENVLCDQRGSVLKIADFGLAREIRSRPPYTEYVATRWYRAPELVLGSCVYSSPVDVWAAGCIVYELLTLRPLFPGASDLDMAARMCSVLGTFTEGTWKEGARLASSRRLRLPAKAAPSLQVTLRQGRSKASSILADAEHLLCQLLAWNPSARPSCASILRGSPFFSSGGPQSGRGGARLVPRDDGAGSSVDGNVREHNGTDSVRLRPPRGARRSIRDGKRQWAAVACTSWSRVVDHARLRELFIRFDTDGSGGIDKFEAALLFKELGLLIGTEESEEEAATWEWLKKVDEDGSGAIEMDELLRWWDSPGGGRAQVAAAKMLGKLKKRVASSRSHRLTAGGGGGGGEGSGGVNSADGGLCGLSAADTRALRSLFALHDRDFSGSIEAHELLPLLVDLGVIAAGADDDDDEEEEAANELLAELEMAAIDANGDDKISFEELCAWWSTSGRGAPPPRPDVAAAQAVSRRLLSGSVAV
jgi:serine/threonine protein kinase/Ca2+-binding EF-hand superfamily protein